MKILFSIFLLFTLPFFTYTQDRVTEPPAKPRILGVVMGISKYQNVPSLRYADRDAMSFYNFLLSPAGGAADTNNIRLLLNEKATSYNFFEAMDNLLDMAKEGDQVYIYFAGHGDIEKKTERQNGFLIGYNAPPNCYAAGGSISVRFLQDYVETLVSKNKSKVTMIIDACRSGKLAGGSQGAEITALALQAEWKGVTKILSCQPGETSLEGEQWGGGAGVFTYFMLRGMKGQADKDGDEKVSVMELNNYLDENVLKETNKKQLPTIIGDRRQDIAKVDKKTYLGMLNQMEKPITLPADNQAAGFEADVSSIKDISVLKEFEKFKYYINNNNLIAYNDTDKDKETALSIYRSLESRRSAQPIISKMKGELVAALQNKAQYNMNEWMNNINTTDLSSIYSTYKEIKAAINIIDSTNSQYEQIKFRYLLWSCFVEKDERIKMKLLEECMKINPNEPFVYFAIGYMYNERKNYNEAYKYYNKATELANNWAWAWCNKGNVLKNLGKYDDALKCYDKAIELKQDFHETFYNKGLMLSNMGKHEEAIKCFDKVLGIKPDFANVWFSKGLLLNNLQKPEVAIKFFDKALGIKPDYFEAWIMKSGALYMLGKYEEALKCSDKALEIKPDYYEAWVGKGSLLYMLGKYEEALKCSDKALEIKPDYYEAWYNKGNAYYAFKKYGEAIKCFDKAIELKPDFFEAWYNKACSYSLIKNKKEMLLSLKKAIELNPQFKSDAPKDEDFKEYWNDPDFWELVK
jgi:protein O-mannosyl-transferase